VATRNHGSSEPSVRNGSELSSLIPANQGMRADATPPRSGRPPVLDDEALDELAVMLQRQLGRLPRLDELIEEAGGCQRQRASKAVQRIRSGAAQLQLQEILRLPSCWRALKTDQLCSLKIDQGWKPGALAPGVFGL